MGGMETANRGRVSLETVSLLPPPSFLKQTAKDRILLNTSRAYAVLKAYSIL